jgi:hypothetical protein
MTRPFELVACAVAMFALAFAVTVSIGWAA